jgi:hypothetical protein
VFLCSSRLHLTGKTLRPLLILGFRAGAFRHPAGEFPLRHLARQVGVLGFRFLLVLLLDAMVHIIEHHDFMPEDFMVEEAVASSTLWATNLTAPGAAAAVHSARQHTPAQTSRTSRATPGVLSATRELLRHPPSSTASPGAMKQWRDDVDHLHSSSTRPRPRSSWRQHEASASVRLP